MREEITRLIEQSPKTVSSRAQLVMREKYETLSGIHDHTNPNTHPLALVTLHDTENTVKGGSFERRIDDYMDYDVLKYTGLSLERLMAYPRWRVEAIIEKCKARQAIDYKNQKDIKDQLGTKD